MPFNSETASEAAKKQKRGKNKLNAEVQDTLKRIIQDQIDHNLEADLVSMPTKDRWDLLAKLSEFAFPKLARIQTEVELNTPFIVYENVSKTHGK